MNRRSFFGLPLLLILRRKGASFTNPALAATRLRFARVAESERAWRRSATEDLYFLNGLEAWDEAMKIERTKRPLLAYDRLSPIIRQVVEERR